jgi:hypothetical protein
MVWRAVTVMARRARRRRLWNSETSSAQRVKPQFQVRLADYATGKTRSTLPPVRAGTVPGWCSPLGTALR